MGTADQSSTRIETDASLRQERQNTDRELAKRAEGEHADADRTLALARERADRLLAVARATADARLPGAEQTEAALALLLEQRVREDRFVADERKRADDLLDRERQELGEKLASLLVLERQATDLHLGLERKSADRAILARDDFLAQVSHDLRGLLAANKLLLTLLMKSAGEELAARVAPLLKIDAQLDRLVSDLIDVVAIEAGKLAVAPSSHAARELLSTAVDVFAPLALERGVSLSVASMPSDVRVMADKVRAVQVLGNLLSNAIKFTPSGGNVRAGFEATADEVEFFVADSGPGSGLSKRRAFSSASSVRAALLEAWGSASSSRRASSAPTADCYGSTARRPRAPFSVSRSSVRQPEPERTTSGSSDACRPLPSSSQISSS